MKKPFYFLFLSAREDSAIVYEINNLFSGESKGLPKSRPA